MIRGVGRGWLWAGALAAVLIGIAVGIGGFTFVYARGASYLTDDPAACANCHVMNEQFSGWQKSSHHAVATCNDCHTPHAFAAKYLVKALNGWHHSSAFTTGNFHEPIRITARNRAITEAQCRRCHAELVATITAMEEGATAAAGPHAAASDLSCIRCHNSVGHLAGD